MAHWKDKQEFKKRVYYYAERLDVHIHSLAIRPMSNKWASCSANGNLNFNTQLLDLGKDIGNYVIVHELLHFGVPNHGKLWKSLMTAYLGDYARLEKKLKRLAKKNNASL